MSLAARLVFAFIDLQAIACVLVVIGGCNIADQRKRRRM